MIYTLQNKEQLPTITQVLGMVGEMIRQMPIRHVMPYDEPVDDGSLFLLNRTASGLFTLKPNITTQPCLFYGDSEYHRVLQSSWCKLGREDYMIENVLREEFELTMASHPLYKLFLDGVPTRKHPVRIINPFGNAAAYGFPSPMLLLTSSLDVAAFMATHKRNETTGKWDAVPEHDENGNVNVGVLYVMELAMPFPMMPGLSCIGMQAFKRPGTMRLFGQNVGTAENFNEHRLVHGFQFKQNPAEGAELGQLFRQGDILTPDEPIARKADDILRTRCVSKQAFELNCRNNPKDDRNLNRKRLENAGVQIVDYEPHLFTEQELNESFYPTAEEQWEEMFSQVIAVHPGFDKMLYDLKDFPNTEDGKKFFRK